MKSQLLFLIILLSTSVTFAQKNCATMDVLTQDIQRNPSIVKNMEEIEKFTQEYVRKNPKGSGSRNVITIPVVFHVVYNLPAENLSDAQLLSQIDALNRDFRFLNTDKVNIPANFAPLAADVEIEFCIAQQSPTGGVTTGINRKQNTAVTVWTTNNNVKIVSKGGLAGWDRNKYLNIWVCNLGTTTGYAQLPGGTASTDGVVLNYRYVGINGTAVAPYNMGRVGTHEVGHWLNLRHIWGDATCGDDLVADTPQANTLNTGCPAVGHLSTCTGTPVEMTNNYMDLTNDGCMNMFTAGQKTRIRAIFAAGGARAALLTSPGCLPPSSSCAIPSGLSSSSVTASGATVTWSAVTGASSYSLQYRPLNTTTWTSVASLTTTSTTLSNLLSSTTYEVQVRTVCGTVTSSFTGSHTFTTSAAAVCVAPTGLTVTNQTSTTADLSWTAYLGALNYTVQIQQSGVTTWTTVATTSQLSQSITNLQPSTNYVARVSSNCSGQTVWSTNIQFSTAASTCVPPTGLTSSGATTTSVVCSWTPVVGANGYTFECSPANTNTWTIHNLTTSSITMTGLLVGTTYDMRVLTSCQTGTTSVYATGQFSTLNEVVCNPPSTITISNITSTGAVSSWPAVTGGASYVFEWRVANQNVAWSASPPLTTTTYSFGGLTANTTYETRVKTNCTGVTSTYSSSVTFNTGGTTTVCSDSYESNTKSTSLAIPTNGTTFTARLNSATDQDWYRFVNTSTAKNIRLRMTALPANYNMKLYRGNTASGTGGSNAGVLDETIIYNNTLTATTYYVNVFGVSGAFNAAACYNFSAEISGTAFTGLDDDNTEVREYAQAEAVKDEFLLFPNPVSEAVTILMPMGEEKEGILAMHDIAGKVHMREKIMSTESLVPMNLDVTTLQPGVYFMTFTTVSKSYTQRLVVTAR